MATLPAMARQIAQLVRDRHTNSRSNFVREISEKLALERQVKVRKI